MNSYSKVLIRVAAAFALVGAFIGSHMAGSGGYEFRTVHAHILVVGWLSLFAWAVFYKVFHPMRTKLATTHVWTSIIGAIGLSTGMFIYYVRPFGLPEPFVTVYFIVGGTTMLISFILFFIITFRKLDV